VQHLALENVDAGVGKAGVYLLTARLLHEPLDPQPVVHLDESVSRSILDRGKGDRRQSVGVLVGFYDLRQVQTGEYVSVGRNERALLVLQGSSAFFRPPAVPSG
jgi:hypothetical protein